MSAAAIITTLMRENEVLRDENGRFLIALRGFEVAPESPFPLVSGEEILAILHPRDAYRSRACRRR
jgi:hypothetical protein